MKSTNNCSILEGVISIAAFVIRFSSVPSAIFIGTFSAFISASQIVPIHPLQVAPLLDGQGSDWDTIAATEVFLHQTHTDQLTAIDKVVIKGGIYANKVYFYLSWADTTENIEHKPFIWNSDKNRYLPTKSLEDRLAIQFEMSGDYTTNWLSGNSFVADMWHWKAYRSNFLGLAQDKQTMVSTEKLLRSYKTKSVQGDDLYIFRPSDEGDRLYKSTRYKAKVSKKMPKYVLTENPQGSIADVKARAVWREGMWHLEMSRSLNTGYPDDVIFESGKQLKGGIAIFNSTGDDDHSVSDILIFQF
jgi:hypothetical protein